MSDLELRLSGLRDEIEWPEAPALEPVLDERPVRRFSWRGPAIVVAMLLALLAGVLAFSPDARNAFLEIFGIEGATVEVVDELPPLDARPLDLGQRVSRREAERRVGFELVDLGRPDAIYVRDRAASLVYGSAQKPRLVLTQLRGGVWNGFVKKVGSTGTRVEPVTVGGEPGLFISGDQHFVMFLDENGAIADEQTYLAGTVLLWNRGPLLLRLEGDLARDRAVELGESID